MLLCLGELLHVESKFIHTKQCMLVVYAHAVISALMQCGVSCICALESEFCQFSLYIIMMHKLAT